MLAGGCVRGGEEEDVGAVEDRPGVGRKEADRLSCEGQMLSYMYACMERPMAKGRGGRYLGVCLVVEEAASGL